MKTLHKRCAGLDVHKKEVVACLRVVARSKATYEVRRFPTTTRDLIALAEWLEAAQCTHVAMEATGVYWKHRVIQRILPVTSAMASARSSRKFSRASGTGKPRDRMR